jgi:hypothetical protein
LSRILQHTLQMIAPVPQSLSRQQVHQPLFPASHHNR